MQKYIRIKTVKVNCFSQSVKAKNTLTGQNVLIVHYKKQFQSFEHAKKQCKLLKCYSKLKKINGIPKLIQAIFQENQNKLYCVLQWMEMNLYERIINKSLQPLQDSQIKLYIYQVLKAISESHQQKVIHRHLRPQNILIKQKQAKICGWDLATKNKATDIPQQIQYTQYIGCRWYRAPQILLTDGYYSQKIDNWSVGCIIYQLYTGIPLFEGENEISMIEKIHEIFGSPPDHLIAKFQNQMISRQVKIVRKQGIGLRKFLQKKYFSKQCIDLMEKLMMYDPTQRISAYEALSFHYLKDAQKQYHIIEQRRAAQPLKQIKVNDEMIKTKKKFIRNNHEKTKINKIKIPKVIQRKVNPNFVIKTFAFQK